MRARAPAAASATAGTLDARVRACARAQRRSVSFDRDDDRGRAQRAGQVVREPGRAGAIELHGSTVGDRDEARRQRRLERAGAADELAAVERRSREVDAREVGAILRDQRERGASIEGTRHLMAAADQQRRRDLAELVIGGADEDALAARPDPRALGELVASGIERELGRWEPQLAQRAGG